MFKTKLLVIALGAAFALPALAEDAPAPASPLSFNVGVVSDYVWRGITQTSHEAAIQGGIDYAHSSGLYVGAWASNINWIKGSGGVSTSKSSTPSTELDTYGGYKGTIATDLTYDVGAIRYNYLVNDYVPSAADNAANGNTNGYVNVDTAEAYLGMSYKIVSLKYSYGLLGAFLGVPDAKGTNYIDLSVAYPVGDSGYTIGAHAGKQQYKGSFVTNTGTYVGNNPLVVDPSCTDYKLSVSKDFSGYVVGLNYTATDVKTNVWTYKLNGTGTQTNWAGDTFALSVLHAF
jgi:uncharacterized protein (TIGR02001 family)